MAPSQTCWDLKKKNPRRIPRVPFAKRREADLRADVFPESLGRNSSRSRPEFLIGWIRDCWFFVATKKAVEGSKKICSLQKLDVFLGGPKKKLVEHFHAESSKCGSGFLHEISGLMGKSLV